MLLTNVLGCDSSRTLFLEFTIIDTSIQQIGPSLHAALDTDSWKWNDCSLVYIGGSDISTFAHNANGAFAVEITKENYIDSSSCIPIQGFRFVEKGLKSIKVDPNPPEGKTVH
jgi:hypothetical protein